MKLDNLFAVVRQHAPALAKASGLRERDVHAIVEGTELAARMFESVGAMGTAHTIVVPALPTETPAPRPRRPRKARTRPPGGSRPKGRRKASGKVTVDGAAVAVPVPDAQPVRSVTPIAQGVPDGQAWRRTASRMMRG